MENKLRWTSALIVVALLAALAAGLAYRRAAQPATPPGPLAHMTVALPVQLCSGAFFVAQQQKLFAQQGLDVTLTRFVLGKQALQAVLDGKADVAVVADTPFVLAVLRGERVAALATIYESRKTIAIVGRRDSGVTDTASLDGKKVGTVLGTNAEFFLDTMLEVHGVARPMVRTENYKPDALVAAFRDKQVDAVTVWNPELARLQHEFGTQAVTIYGEDLFVYRFLLVAKQAYIASHGAQLRQLLATLKQGNDDIKEHPERTRTLLGKEIGMEPDLLRHSFDATDYTMVLDQSLLLTLSAQMRWAMDKDLAPVGPAPDYQDYVRPEPLGAVAPHANRIIR
jgi:ABC-type nitrate/sulfonate/bicarbonate transport system substrate-binding protein